MRSCEQKADLANRTGITFWFVEHVYPDYTYDGYDITSWAVYIPEKIDTIPEKDLNNIWHFSGSADIRLFIHGESGGNPRGEWINSQSC